MLNVGNHSCMDESLMLITLIDKDKKSMCEPIDSYSPKINTSIVNLYT